MTIYHEILKLAKKRCLYHRSDGIIYCSICGYAIASGPGSVFTFLKHLRECHNEVYLALKQEVLREKYTVIEV